MFSEFIGQWLFPGNPNYHCDPPGWKKYKEKELGLIINDILAQVSLTMNPVGVQSHPMFISLTLESRVRRDMVSKLQNPHTASLT